MHTAKLDRENAPDTDWPNASFDLGSEIESLINTAPNNEYLGNKLETLGDPAKLLVFLHRFLIFNDALAARVPYLAGLIHLTPNVFVEVGGGFLGQVNARIAAYVVEAASDEYRMTPAQNLVHQHLSQKFFRGALAHYQPQGGPDFERLWPTPAPIETLLAEARSIFFTTPTEEDLFRALGFHLGLEFFANEEFNLVDHFLRTRHGGLVEALKRDGDGVCAYTWLSLHTVVEIGHYRAGLEAAREAMTFYRDRTQAAAMADRIFDGLRTFADLQLRYYQAVFAEVV